MYATQAPVLSNLSIGDSAKIIKKTGKPQKKQRKEGKKKIKKTMAESTSECNITKYF